MNNRIHISKLQIEGNGLEPAIINFETGLNLISGPSDTGKTFIFDTLYFMFGGDEAPDQDFEIPESVGYTTILLEIKIGQKTYTLKRGRRLKSGTDICECKIEEITQKTEFIEYSPSGKNNLSSFFLQKLGLSDSTKVLHKASKTGNLTITDFKNLFFVNETKIMDNLKSPILSRDGQEIRNKSVLSLLLANENYNDLDINNIDNIILQNDATIKFIRQQIDEIKKENEKLKENKNFKEKNSIQAGIEYLYGKKTDLQKEINNHFSKIDMLTSDLKKLKGKKVNSETTINRFRLLERFYITDLKRLEFNKEAQENISMLVNVNCPICGNEKIKCEEVHYDTVISAIDCEKGKILLNMSALKDSLKQACADLKKINQEIVEKQTEIIDINNKYEYSMKPDLDFNILQLEEYLNKQLTIKEYKKNEKRIEKYQGMITELWKTIEANENKRINTKNILEKNADKINSLGDEIKKLIIEWSVPIEKDIDNIKINIEYDYKKNDFKINNRSRNSYGKGIRALLYAAFMVGFMKYCVQNNELHHPGLVIIDSPLTTFKEGRDDVKTHDFEKDKELPKTVHDCLYFNFAKDIDNQYIVIENNDKVPNEKFNLDYNLITFTKNIKNGRYGFFPLKKEISK